jgi:hypothetical protein
VGYRDSQGNEVRQARSVTVLVNAAKLNVRIDSVGSIFYREVCSQILALPCPLQNWHYNTPLQKKRANWKRGATFATQCGRSVIAWLFAGPHEAVQPSLLLNKVH